MELHGVCIICRVDGLSFRSRPDINNLSGMSKITSFPHCFRASTNVSMKLCVLADKEHSWFDLVYKVSEDVTLKYG